MSMRSTHLILSLLVALIISNGMPAKAFTSLNQANTETVIFADDFDDNQNEWDLSPFSGKFTDCTYAITDGLLEQNCAYRDFAIAPINLPGLSAKDFSLSFEFSVAQQNEVEGDRLLEVLVRANEKGEYYNVSFGENGQVAVYAKIQDEFQTLQEWIPTGVFDLKLGETNLFKIQLVGQKLQIFVNEQEVLVIEELSYREQLGELGPLGIGFSASEGQEVTLQFDNMVVTEMGDTDQTTDHTNNTHLEETFDSNQNGWKLGKYADSNSIGETRTTNGKLRITNNCKRNSTRYINIPFEPIFNFVLNIDSQIQKSEGTEAWIDLLFRGTKDSWYRVAISNLGAYSISKWFNDGQEFSYLQEWTKSDAIQTKNGKLNQIQLDVEGAFFTLSLNGEELVTVEDSQDSIFGIMTLGVGCTKDGSVTVEFDNLSILPLSDDIANSDADVSQATATPKTSSRRSLPTPKPPTATPEPPTATPEPPTATPEPPTATPEPPTATPEPTATATSADPMAVVLINKLNVRSGPGTNYPVISGLNAGERLPVRGQVNGCAWLQVQLANQKLAWVSGGAQYTSLEGVCGNIPYVQPPPPPTPRPAAPRPAAPSAPASSQGCYNFRNYISAELTVTFTSGDGRQNQTFKVPNKGSLYLCFAAGRYTVTVDAPPPWGSYNTAVEITPGMYEEWPVWGEN